MNALRVETCMLYMYFKETSLISHASLESWNKESINQKLLKHSYSPDSKEARALENSLQIRVEEPNQVAMATVRIVLRGNTPTGTRSAKEL